MRARLNAIRFVLSSLPYSEKDEKKIGTVDPRIVFRAAAVTGLTKKDKDDEKIMDEDRLADKRSSLR